MLPEVELEQLVEGRAVTGLAPQPLGPGVALDQVDPLGRAPGESQIAERLVIDREEGGGRPELRAHVADRRAVGQREGCQPIAGELDERADDAVGAQQLGHDQDEVGRGRAAWQGAVQADADDVRHRLVERLAQQDGLGLDPADAIAQDAQAVDHRRVRVGPDDRVGEGQPAAGRTGPVDDHGGQELEVDLVDDAGPGWHDAQVAERRLRPAQQLVALAVAVVFALDVEGERAGRAEPIDLDRVIDHEVGRHERIDPRRVATEVGHRVAHDRQVHHRRDAGEVLEQHARRHERDLRLRRRARAPGEQGLDVLLADDAGAGMSEQVLEQDLDRHRQAVEIQPVRDRARAGGSRSRCPRRAAWRARRTDRGRWVGTS